MKEYRELTVKEKALKINLDPSIYGSFAEIGAGQEVAANFFKSGAASGTIAQTRSAYDMRISDSVYGTCERYVCEPRLIRMLDIEYAQLLEQLNSKSSTTKFFTFANTIQTINYTRTNKGHGWLGLRFQLKPDSEPNDCIIHVNLNDTNPVLQQEAIGILGVNLIYACMYLHNHPESLLNSLIHEIGRERIEINFFRLTGPDFKHIDNRLLSLKLVKNGLSDASMFGADGNVMLPMDALYKKNILVIGGRFRPVTKVNIDMFESSREEFLNEADVDSDNVVEVSALTLQNLSAGGEIDDQDFLDRVDILCSLNKSVLITRYAEHYQLVEYLNPFSRGNKIGVVLGIYNFINVFDEYYYSKLNGGILEAFGKLFGNNVKLYVYPSFKPNTNEVVNFDNFELPENMKGLLKFLKDNNKIEALPNVNYHLLHIFSDNVLAMIKRGEEGWEEMVPETVAKQVKEKCLFEYPCIPEIYSKIGL